MQVNVVGKQIDIGEALRSHVEDRLSRGIGKYFSRPGRAHVFFSREGPDFRCDCTVHLDSGITLQSSGEAGDIYASFEMAADRMEKRVRRYKRRLKSHHAHKKQARKKAQPASTYVIAPQNESEEEPEDLQPVIIAETTTDIQTLSVGEAVMQLDLAESPVVIFFSSATDQLNVVYRRADGNIGWINPDGNTTRDV